MMESLLEPPSSVSMSRLERPRCSVLFLAAARIAPGVRYGRGKDCMVLYTGRVIEL
jgi:hypothetical protein